MPTANRGRLALAYLSRGTAHMRSGNRTLAEPDYREAIRLDSIPIDSGEKEVPSTTTAAGRVRSQ